MFSSSGRGCGSASGRQYSPPQATGLPAGEPVVHPLPSQLTAHTSLVSTEAKSKTSKSKCCGWSRRCSMPHVFFFLIFPLPQKYPRLERQAALSKGEGASTGTLLSGAVCLLNGFRLQAFLKQWWCQVGEGVKKISPCLSWFIVYQVLMVVFTPITPNSFPPSSQFSATKDRSSTDFQCFKWGKYYLKSFRTWFDTLFTLAWKYH